MTTQTSHFSPLFVLAALGVLGLSNVSAAEVDTSQWKCEKCPYAKGTTGTVEAGLGLSSDDAPHFGNFTGLKDKGAHLLLGGSVEHRPGDGSYAGLNAADFGLDTRRLGAQAGREGLYALQLGYGEIPRSFAQGGLTPFIGSGGNTLTLPAAVGYPAATTSAMPLGATLQAADLGYKASQLSLDGKWVGHENWTYRVKLRRDVRNGTRPTAGSFFSTASQLAAPVDETTEQVEFGASYVTPQLQVSLSYLVSQFKNGSESLTWDNPFLAVLGGDTRGQLALAPRNQFQQLVGSAGFQISPTVRASADVAWGLGEQNAGFLAPTLNSSLAVPGLPAPSLDGQVETFNASARITATPMDGLRLNALVGRDVRDNQTAIQAYPQVATDMFVSPVLRSNTPFDQTHDRVRLAADYRLNGAWKLSGGIDWDGRQRAYQEAVITHETTVWGRAAVQAAESLSLAFKAAHGERSNKGYGTAYWFGSTNNPLLRKFNLAPRERGSFGARADWSVTETVSLGLSADFTSDKYKQTAIGLEKSETASLGLDAAVAVSEHTRLRAFAQAEQIKSQQAGSQLFGAADWTGKVDDRFEVLGVGISHAAIPDKLDIGADLSFARSRSDTTVQTAVGEPPFPSARTVLDSAKIHATYKLQGDMWLTASWWHERYDATAWPLDGVQPATVPNLLALGAQAPQYRVNVLRLALRYRF